jgi:hypothetical protein
MLLTESSFLYVQNDLDNYEEFTYHFYRLYVKGITNPLGFIHGSIIVELPWLDYWTYSSNDKSLTFSGGKDVAERTKFIRKTLLRAKDKAWKVRQPGMPLDPVRHFQYDETPVYSYDGQHIMNVDLAAAEMFGVPTYAVALTAWTYIDGHRRYWIPQFASNHTTHPGKYHNFVSGLLRAGDNHFERIKELVESQAWLPTDITNHTLRSCGTISYITHTHMGLFMHSIQPHVEYVYEIELGPGVHPAYSDECQSMKKYSANQVYGLLAAGEFEPHAQMTLLDHFIRHGYINAGNEPRLQDIQVRLHRRIEFLGV